VKLLKGGIAAGLIAASGTSASAATMLDITLDFGTSSGLSAGQKSIFGTAGAIWEYLLPSYAVDLGTGSNEVTIAASSFAGDGVGGVLASAGPNTVTLDSEPGVGSYAYTKTGSMQFDSADLDNLESNGRLLAVILHEMAHVMGFGTLWNIGEALGPTYSTYQAVYVTGSGQYAGAAALAAWQADGNPDATFVPVELGGGTGTAGGHWDEPDGGFPNGDPELMTGWLNSGPFLSTYSLASFEDICYVTRAGYTDATVSELSALVAAVPLPAGLPLGLTGLLMLGLMRRRC